MSYRNYSGGEPRRSYRTEAYDPYAESHRYDADQQRRETYSNSRDSERNSSDAAGYATRSYGASSASVASQQSRQGYTTDTRNIPAMPSAHHGTYGRSSSSSMKLRDVSGYSSGIQQGEVWKTSGVPQAQQRSSSRQEGYTSYGSERDSYRSASAWAGNQPTGSTSGSSSRRQEPTVSYDYKGSGGMRMGVVMSPPSLPMQVQQQPVLMMVPPGSANNLMGLVGNQFAVQRQGVPMIVGSLPAALNPNVFDQHLLAQGGSYGGTGTQSRHSNVGRSSGRNDGDSSSYRHGARGLASSSRGIRRSPLKLGGRRRSPDRGMRRNAVYRRPGNVASSNVVSRKRSLDAVSISEAKKKMRTSCGNAVPAVNDKTKPSGNQRRKAKQRRDVDTKAKGSPGSAKTSSTTSPTTPSSNKASEKDKKNEKQNEDVSGKTKSPSAAEAAKQTEAVVNSQPDDDCLLIEPSKTEKVEEKKRKSKYEGFPTQLLVCKICQKSMNDGASFESHLSGRAHMALVKIIEEKFQKRAEMLMLESKLAEEEIGIELDRQKRAGKSGGNASKANNHCKMCDCTYMTNWGAHKISLGHRILKEFLHPSCRECNVNFMHRMDWLAHLFSLSHLNRVSEVKHAGKDVTAHESSTQEELFTINLELSSEDKPANFLSIRNLNWKTPAPSHIKEIVDENEFEVPEGEIVLPEEHDENIAIGQETIIKTEGYCCKACRIYISQEKEVEGHCKSTSHFGMYVSYLKKLITLRAEQLAAAEKAGEPMEHDAQDVVILDDDGITDVDEILTGENIEGENDSEVHEVNGDFYDEETEDYHEEETGGEVEESFLQEESELDLDAAVLNESELLNSSADEEALGNMQPAADFGEPEKEETLMRTAEPVTVGTAGTELNAQKGDSQGQLAQSQDGEAVNEHKSEKATAAETVVEAEAEKTSEPETVVETKADKAPEAEIVVETKAEKAPEAEIVVETKAEKATEVGMVTEAKPSEDGDLEANSSEIEMHAESEEVENLDEAEEKVTEVEKSNESETVVVTEETVPPNVDMCEAAEVPETLGEKPAKVNGESDADAMKVKILPPTSQQTEKPSARSPTRAAPPAPTTSVPRGRGNVAMRSRGNTAVRSRPSPTRGNTAVRSRGASIRCRGQSVPAVTPARGQVGRGGSPRGRPSRPIRGRGQ